MLPWNLVLLLVPHLWDVRLVAALNHSWQTWGPYRPNLYFGVRPQIPETLLMGLMWASGDGQTSRLRTLRSTCEQDDGMQGYGWTAYDVRAGGSQTMHDRELGIDLGTDFVKSESGESWAVRVRGSPRPDGPRPVKTTVIFHVAMEKAQQDDRNRLRCERGEHGLTSTNESAVVCDGDANGLGAHEIRVSGDHRNSAVEDAAVVSLQVPEEDIWQAKSLFQQHVQRPDARAGPDDAPGPGNLHFIHATFEGPFTVTLSYRSLANSSKPVHATEMDWDAPRAAFAARMDKVFPRAAPFRDEKYAAFSQSLLSNLLGGLGFFHGDSRVDYSNAPEYAETDPEFWVQVAQAKARATVNATAPVSLLSFTPSRPFFPRGFLWDEGFHLLPVLEWDFDLAVSVLQSWVSLMDADGWIAREQILGPEARAKVPDEFQVQYPQHANPPTLLLVFPKLMAKLSAPSAYAGHPSRHVSSGEDADVLLRTLYASLKRHYEWFRRTQAGNFTSAYPRPDGAASGEGYRWRGRTPQHTFASGLDDYPRAEPPHPGELHADALAWGGASARALQQVAEFLGEREDAEMFGKQLLAVKHNLDALHWDDTLLVYCDATVHGAGFKRVCHPGYVSLLPLLLGLLDPDHPHLPLILDAMSSSSMLGSPHGLRSLSAEDPNYGKGENYWRGAVWMNLNVLAVLSLQEIGLHGLHGRDEGAEAAPVQARALAHAGHLRNRLVRTVYDSWEKTGFVWEQYSDKTGEGSRSRAFTGWTACVLLLMGLDLPAGTMPEAGTGRSSSGPGAFPIALVALVALGIVFRRRIKPLMILTAQVWHTGRQYWSGRNGYEQVMDLDELDRRNGWRRSTTARGASG